MKFFQSKPAEQIPILRRLPKDHQLLAGLTLIAVGVSIVCIVSDCRTIARAARKAELTDATMLRAVARLRIAQQSQLADGDHLHRVTSGDHQVADRQNSLDETEAVMKLLRSRLESLEDASNEVRRANFHLALAHPQYEDLERALYAYESAREEFVLEAETVARVYREDRQQEIAVARAALLESERQVQRRLEGLFQIAETSLRDSATKVNQSLMRVVVIALTVLLLLSGMEVWLFSANRKLQRDMQARSDLPPAREPQRQASDEIDYSRFIKGIRILLADDGARNQRLFRKILVSAGAKVTLCENGQQVLDFIQAAQGTADPVDMLVIDMQMPVLDGYVATRQLRERGFDGPVIGITASEQPEARKFCLAAGCNDQLAKPIDQEALLSCVAKHARGLRTSAAL